MIDSEAALLAEAQLGIEAEAFMESHLGRYFSERIQADIDDAHEALEKVCPSDFDAIIKLQNQVYRARTVRDWIVDAIANGQYAQSELSESR